MLRVPDRGALFLRNKNERVAFPRAVLTSMLDLNYKQYPLTLNYFYNMTLSKNTIIALALISGAGITLSFTLQNRQIVTEAGESKHFYHPYMQAALRSFSYLLCIFVVLFQKAKLQSEGFPKINVGIILIPAVIELATSVCYFVALNFINGSIYQMLRGGGTVLSTYFLTLAVFKTSPKRQKIIGCGIVLLGMGIVGLVNLWLGDKQKQSDEELMVVGYGLILLGVIGTGIHFIIQEELMKKYGLNPLWLVSLKGCFGLLFSSLILPFMAFVDCPFSQEACVINDDGQPIVEHIGIYFRELSQNSIIFLGFVLVTIFQAIFCSTTVIIAKRISSLARAIVDVSRTVLIWIGGVLITILLGSNNPSFKWQSLDRNMLLGQTFGFSLLVMGSLIYYQFLSLKCLKEKLVVKNTLEQLTQQSQI